MRSSHQKKHLNNFTKQPVLLILPFKGAVHWTKTYLNFRNSFSGKMSQKCNYPPLPVRYSKLKKTYGSSSSRLLLKNYAIVIMWGEMCSGFKLVGWKQKSLSLYNCIMKSKSNNHKKYASVCDSVPYS